MSFEINFEAPSPHFGQIHKEAISESLAGLYETLHSLDSAYDFAEDENDVKITAHCSKVVKVLFDYCISIADLVFTDSEKESVEYTVFSNTLIRAKDTFNAEHYGFALKDLSQAVQYYHQLAKVESGN